MKGLQVALSVLVIAGAVVFLMVDSLSSSEALTYFHGADVVMARSDEFVGKRIRVGGHVAPGSVAQKPGTLQWSFRVQPVEQMMKHPEVADRTLPVFYEGVVPDTFEDDAEVIVTGVLSDDGTFQAQELIAKCPSKYEVAETASR
ncbi:MAG TPA: cytochrome c maturation protein CcmE [Myxococcales bacterium LLY-WYZ-16_1]|nr:cytochrome c maturation protein CcmE [Myxococcales bacterium LLY-WYZ-16_1]